MWQKFADIPNGMAAISKVPARGWAQLVAYMKFADIPNDLPATLKVAAIS